MWKHFYEEAARKTATRLLATRLPLSNPSMEALAEAATRDQEAQFEELGKPAGRTEFEDVTYVSPEKPVNFEDFQAVPEKKVSQNRLCVAARGQVRSVFRSGERDHDRERENGVH